MNVATSKYDRELRFIEIESKRLDEKLRELRESVPSDPAEAARKAEDVTAMEARLADLLRRRKEIVDSYKAAGMDVPDIHRSLNANTWKEGRGCETGAIDVPDQPAAEAPEAIPGDIGELTSEIESVTDELMGIEVKMLRADMNGDEDEKQKLSLMASSLRSRRDTLVARVKELKAEAKKPKEAPAAEPSEIESRLESLERDNRALRSQLSDVRTDMSEVKESLREILSALRLE